jgi:hypothetical protein
MSETSDRDLGELQLAGERLVPQLYINKHLAWDSTRGNGDIYIMYKLKSAEQRRETLLKYATKEQAWDFIHVQEKRAALRDLGKEILIEARLQAKAKEIS